MAIVSGVLRRREADPRRDGAGERGFAGGSAIVVVGVVVVGVVVVTGSSCGSR
jgi:hypothetical protein